MANEITGIPRITRPRTRKNADNLCGFSVIDPAETGLATRALTQAREVPLSEAERDKLAETFANLEDLERHDE